MIRIYTNERREAETPVNTIFGHPSSGGVFAGWGPKL
jgi:hypothetical protein